MRTENDLWIGWLKFLEKFTDNQFDLSDKIVKVGDSRFEINNFLNTGINLNGSYGFLTLDFRQNNCKWNVQDFISATQIIFKSQIIEKMTLQSTNWSAKYYTCRIFGADNKGRIRFYRKDNITNLDELLESYITVFQSVVFAIIKLKIQSAKNK